MPFDPTKPANNTALNSAELRAQLTSLKALIDATPTTAAMTTFVTQNAAGNCDSLTPLNLAVSNPPTQAQVQAIASKLDQLILHLTRAV